MRRIAIAVMMVVILVGCVTTPQVPPEAKTRTYDADMSEVFDAVRMYYADIGAQIQAGGREDGYLNATVQTEQERAMLSGYQIVYNAQFFATDSGVRVYVDIMLEDESAGVTMTWGEEKYQEFFTEVSARL